MTKLELEKMAVEIRKSIVTGVHSAKSGHPGGSLSAADIFTYLYFEEMHVTRKMKTETGLCSQKAMLRRDFTPHWHTEVIFR